MKPDEARAFLEQLAERNMARDSEPSRRFTQVLAAWGDFSWHCDLDVVEEERPAWLRMAHTAARWPQLDAVGAGSIAAALRRGLADADQETRELIDRRFALWLVESTPSASYYLSSLVEWLASIGGHFDLAVFGQDLADLGSPVWERRRKAQGRLSEEYLEPAES